MPVPIAGGVHDAGTGVAVIRAIETLPAGGDRANNDALADMVFRLETIAEGIDHANPIRVTSSVFGAFRSPCE